MDFSNLEYFCQLYTHRSFSLAAEQIPMTTQGLRKSIRALELELGAPLCFSTKNGVQFTEAGERLYRFSLNALPQYHLLLKDISILNEAGQKKFSVGFSFGSFGLFSPRFPEQILAKFPPQRITFTSLPESVLYEELKNGGFDLAVTWGGNPDSLFSYYHLAQVPVYAIFNPKHPKASCQRLTLNDLQGEALISIGPLHKPHNLLMEACRRQGFTPDTTYCTSELPVTMTYLKHNLGIGFALKNELSLYEANQLRPVFLTDYSLPIGITRRKHAALAEEERIICELLKKSL